MKRKEKKLYRDEKTISELLIRKNNRAHYLFLSFNGDDIRVVVLDNIECFLCPAITETSRKTFIDLAARFSC
ncbi:hypothetical protein V1478_003955 [Vespula squamosa]|uniref:Uncharacterized protein n=1 Tax=Vespula squamosa TaxID=30214 RepID=A0ABD2BNB6_VESSQ